MENHTNTKIQRIKTTCLWGCFGLSCSCLSFPVIFLLPLCLNPRSQQPLRSNAPTLPASSIPILMWISQLATRAWSKPADRCHKTEEGEGERKTRTEMEKGGRSRAFPLSSFSGRQKRSDRKGLNGPVNPQINQGLDPVWSVCICVCVWFQPRSKLCHSTRCKGDTAAPL